MIPILMYMADKDNSEYINAFKAICPEVDIRAYPDWGDPSEESYAFLWKPEPGIVAKYPNIKVIFYGGAGVDHLVADKTFPTTIPIVRLSDSGLKEGMADWVVMSVLLHQRKMPEVLANQRRKLYQKIIPTLSADLSVGFMGYGALSKACAERLKPFGFKINTWSTSTKNEEDGVKHYTGSEMFKGFLEQTDILVSLLPATVDTNDLLNADTLACLPKGAAVINAGRGNVLDTDALLDLIDAGHIDGASIDVFKIEPLPANDPLWQNEKIILTPHISAETRIETSCDYVLKAISDYERDGTLINLYEKDRGY